MIASALPRALNVLAAVTQATLRVLDRFGAKRRRQKDLPLHQQIGRQGEEDAYFYLRKRGYMMVGRNYRPPARRGEIDLIGWDGDILCFIEVKTRTSHDVKPAEAAVDHEKRREMAGMARAYLRRLPEVPWRFDVVSVYYESPPVCGLALSCSKMPSQYRRINDSADSYPVIVKGFSNCPNLEKIPSWAGG
jgi:putative endonuclease